MSQLWRLKHEYVKLLRALLLVQKAYHVATVAIESMSLSMSSCCRAIVGAEGVSCRNCGA